MENCQGIRVENLFSWENRSITTGTFFQFFFHIVVEAEKFVVQFETLGCQLAATFRASDTVVMPRGVIDSRDELIDNRFITFVAKKRIHSGKSLSKLAGKNAISHEPANQKRANH